MSDQEHSSAPVPTAEPDGAPDLVSDAVDHVKSGTDINHSGVEDIIFSTRSRTKPIRGV